MPSNLGHLAPAPLARRLVDPLQTKITRLLGNLGRNLAVFARRLVYLLETKLARLRGNLAQTIALNSRRSFGFKGSLRFGRKQFFGLICGIGVREVLGTLWFQANAIGRFARSGSATWTSCL